MSKTSLANRGMGFEAAIEYSNRQYESKGLAVVNKRPTPVRIVSKKAGRVTGFFEMPSTVDFDGTLPGGRSVVFEAKQVKEHRFELSKLRPHQVEYLEKCHRLGAISFVLIDMVKLETIYLLPYQSLRTFWDRRKHGRGYASLSADDLSIHAWEVKSGTVPVDWLPVVYKVWGDSSGLEIRDAKPTA